MNDKEQHRYEHFKKRILNGKSPHLSKLSSDIYISRNFVTPNTLTEASAVHEAAKSQAGFIKTLIKGEKVHIVNKKHPNIIVGKVHFIGKTTFRIKDDNRFYQLSEIITIEGI
jgi:hypothetical protein